MPAATCLLLLSSILHVHTHTHLHLHLRLYDRPHRFDAAGVSIIDFPDGARPQQQQGGGSSKGLGVLRTHNYTAHLGRYGGCFIACVHVCVCVLL